MTSNMLASKAQSLVSNKKEMYEAMYRNQYWLPTFKSQMMTESWLLDAYEGLVFVLPTS